MSLWRLVFLLVHLVLLDHECPERLASGKSGSNISTSRMFGLVKIKMFLTRLFVQNGFPKNYWIACFILSQFYRSWPRAFAQKRNGLYFLVKNFESSEEFFALLLKSDILEDHRSDCNHPVIFWLLWTQRVCEVVGMSIFLTGITDKLNFPSSLVSCRYVFFARLAKCIFWGLWTFSVHPALKVFLMTYVASSIKTVFKTYWSDARCWSLISQKCKTLNEHFNLGFFLFNLLFSLFLFNKIREMFIWLSAGIQ